MVNRPEPELLSLLTIADNNSMKVSISTYWKCQLIGWGGWFLFDYLLVELPFMTSLMASIFGLLFTHFIRYLIKQFKILNKTTVTQIVYLLLINMIVSFLGIWFFVWFLDVTGILYKTFLQILSGFLFGGRSYGISTRRC